MLCAEIHGKVSAGTPAHDRMEDTLTSYVFSLFRYLKNMEIPAAFLRRARNIHNHNFPIEALTAGDVFFWPLFKFETTK